MSEKIKISEGAEGEWKIPKETNIEHGVLEDAKVGDFVPYENEEKYDSGENLNVDPEVEHRIELFEKARAKRIGKRVLALTGKAA